VSKGDVERYVDQLIENEVTRRRLLRQGAAGAMSFGALAWLAACGGGGIEGTGTKAAASSVIPKGEIAKEMTFSNWPLYIDVDDKTKKRPTLENFEKKFGTKVKYVEEVNDNTEFYGKVRQQLAQKQSGGRDIFVVTDWMAGKMKQLGYVQKLDKSVLPNVTANLIDRLKSPPFDPARDYSVPWQSGMTAIVYRKDLTGGKLSSINDIFDKKFKGKVSMLTEMRDTVGLTMLGMGADPEKDGTDKALEAIDKIDKANKDGQIRNFTGNDYTKDLLKGDTVAVYGWSGDSVQLKNDNKDIEFLFPEEGFMLWTDNMEIPVGAPHAYTAEVFMNYVYDPEVQAKIAEYVNYVTPVKGTKEVVAKADPKLAENVLIFPDDQTLAKAKIFRELKEDEAQQLDEAFQKVIGA
jgi:spermidine/putrescine transport system substrate-binding protein